LCCDKNTLLQTKLSLILPVSQIFSLYLQHRSATTAVVRNDFIEKVLLKLSSNIKFSQSLNGTKMIAVAPHHLVYAYPNRFEYYHFGVGYCFIRVKGSADP
jgi:hypothetical protein